MQHVSSQGKKGKLMWCFGRKTKETDNLEDLRKDGIIIIKWILN